jgi:hypothetical protein
MRGQTAARPKGRVNFAGAPIKQKPPDSGAEPLKSPIPPLGGRMGFPIKKATKKRQGKDRETL